MDPRESAADARRRQPSLLLAALMLAAAGVLPFAAATLPPGFAETQVAFGLSSPTAMAFAPDGRLFVCEQAGRVRLVKNQTLLGADFLTLTVDSSGERGLLGIAVDPAFASTQFVYVYYTVSTAPIHNRISRFTAAGDVAAPGSELVILELESLSGATNHNGGAIHFGPDGKLYVAVGDNANDANSQVLTNRLGKVLRINPDGTIPTDNPFYLAAVGANRSIWALGLRNPFTFGFHPTNGRMFINDVGQNTWEEINDGIAESNYGWSLFEGPGAPPPFRNPVYAYQHASGTPTGCAIVGGAFYDSARGRYPAEFERDYFFADLCGGWVWRYDSAAGTASEFITGIATPVDLKIGPMDGDLYYLARSSGANGAVYRVSIAADAAIELTLVGGGAGDGRVTSQAGLTPAIDCTITGGAGAATGCNGGYARGVSVTLGAAPATDSIFTGWNGGGCSGAGSCTVTMAAATAVTARFNPVGPRPSFTDDPLVVRTTPVKAVHLTELRQAIGMLRARYNLPAFAWTDPALSPGVTAVKAAHLAELPTALTLTPGVTAVKAAHLAELRTALTEVYTAAAQAPPSFTTPSLVGGQTVIAATHIEELRAAVLGIW